MEKKYICACGNEVTAAEKPATCPVCNGTDIKEVEAPASTESAPEGSEPATQ